MIANPAQLEAALHRKFGPVKRSQGHNGLELITRCPVCGKRKLSVNASSGIYKCWRGCTGGHISNLLENISVAKLEAAFRRPEPQRISAPPGELVPLTQLSEDHHANSYLINRGFDIAELNDLYGIRYCALGKKFMGGIFDTTNTIIIPVYMMGKVMGWQSRLLYDPDKVPDEHCEAMGYIRDEDGDWIRPPKYFTDPAMKKSEILWNYDWARQSQLVVITEGVFDALAVGRCAIATLGKGVSDTQKSILASNWEYAVCLLDPDAEADNIKLAEGFGSSGMRAVALRLEGYKDAGEAPRNEIWRQIDSALRGSEVELSKLRFIV